MSGPLAEPARKGEHSDEDTNTKYTCRHKERYWPQPYAGQDSICTAAFQFSESGSSLSGPDLITELPLL